MSQKKEKADTPAPDKIRVKTIGRFIDGGLRQQFAAEGLKLEWPAGEERTISVNLYRLCLQSGARLEVL